MLTLNSFYFNYEYNSPWVRRCNIYLALGIGNLPCFVWKLNKLFHELERSTYSLNTSAFPLFIKLFYWLSGFGTATVKYSLGQMCSIMYNHNLINLAIHGAI